VPLKETSIQALTDLADRIPYNGVMNSDPQVWKKFNTSLAKVTKVEDT
jgi:hypothetical protein